MRSFLQLFVERVETQLFGAEALPIRNVIDERYKTLVSTMFENLQHMAKMGQQQAAANSAEDKDQLNYHIVLIGAFGNDSPETGCSD